LPDAPTPPVVAIGANCATLGAAGVTETGAPAYCSRLQTTGATVWSLNPGEIASPTVTPGPGEEVYPAPVEGPVRMCVQQTGQTRLQCWRDIRRANELAGG
jgi:serine/threonine-protein kinase